MGSIPFAFSVHHFISSVGADAGFASIIGLAILVLLYFAQARETASLREQAYESAQRIQHLEGRLSQAFRQQGSAAAPGVAAGAHAVPGAARPVTSPLAAAPAAARSPAPAGGAGGAAPAGAPVPAGALAGVPAAPAGVAAPALTAATKLIPTPDRSIPQPVAGASDQPVEATAAVAPSPATPSPATVAGGANGAAHENLQPQPVGAGQAPLPPPPRVQVRPGASTAPGRRPPSAPRGQATRGGIGRSRARRVLAGLLAALLVAGVVVVLLLVTGSNSSKNAATSSGQASNAPTPHRHSKPAAFNSASVTAAVLNGTATAGLAHRVAVKLSGAGYKQGTVATATDQTRTATVVAYMPGHRRDALAVASTLKLGSASVQPVDQNTQAVACPPPSACTATVVVTVGSDLASTQ
jgi:LytR cell envelope-related transcriptional attenuator